MIELRNISKSYGNTKVIKNLSIEIGKKEPLVLFGPSGCGKTTILRLIAGLEMPEEGNILIDGKIVSEPGWTLHPNKRKLGIVFQAPALWPHMTVEKNILFGLDDRDAKNSREKASEIIAEAGLGGLEKRYPHQLSGGQAKRVAFARALVCSKDYYLLDEPLSNQDDKLKEELLLLLMEKVRSNGAGLVYVTHDMEEAVRISGRIQNIM